MINYANWNDYYFPSNTSYLSYSSACSLCSSITLGWKHLWARMTSWSLLLTVYCLIRSLSFSIHVSSTLFFLDDPCFLICLRLRIERVTLISCYDILNSGLILSYFCCSCLDFFASSRFFFCQAWVSRMVAGSHISLWCWSYLSLIATLATCVMLDFSPIVFFSLVVYVQYSLICYLIRRPGPHRSWSYQRPIMPYFQFSASWDCSG